MGALGAGGLRGVFQDRLARPRTLEFTSTGLRKVTLGLTQRHSAAELKLGSSLVPLRGGKTPRQMDEDGQLTRVAVAVSKTEGDNEKSRTPRAWKDRAVELDSQKVASQLLEEDGSTRSIWENGLPQTRRADYEGLPEEMKQAKLAKRAERRRSAEERRKGGGHGGGGDGPTTRTATTAATATMTTSAAATAAGGGGASKGRVPGEAPAKAAAKATTNAVATTETTATVTTTSTTTPRSGGRKSCKSSWLGARSSKKSGARSSREALPGPRGPCGAT